MRGSRVDPPGLAPRPYYTHALVREGQPVFLTGQVAWDAEGRVVGPGDIARQARQVWDNVEAVLHGMDADLGDVVKITTYALDRAFIPALHAERERRFPHGRHPASTFLQVSGLAEPELLVEIEAIAILAPTHPLVRGGAASGDVEEESW